MSYYTMYDSLTALFFKAGIKCENHAGSILLFKKLFGRQDLFKLISFAKEERIDKQYYVTSKQEIPGEGSAKDLVSKAENFAVQIKLIIQNLANPDIEKIREKFREI